MEHELKHYILDGYEVVLEPDLLKWCVWMAATERHVAVTQIDDVLEVSTVFLGLDHNFTKKGPPRVFETKVFGSLGKAQDRDEVNIAGTYRYATWEEAEQGHKEVVQEVKQYIAKQRKQLWDNHIPRKENSSE